VSRSLRPADKLRSAPPVAPSDTPAGNGDKEDRTTAHPPPAGPRATRSSGSVPPSAAGPKGTPNKVSNAPTGPSRTAPNPILPQKPTASMGPPKALTADEERAAARSQRFGSLVSDSMPIRGSASTATTASPSRVKTEDSPMPPPASASTTTKKEDDNKRPKSPPLPPSRKASPGPGSTRAKRSGSIESRTSERSRRDHRDRERSGRDREREREDRRGKDKQSSRATTPSSTEKGGEGDSRKKQEDLLQARHDKLAGEERRSSGSRRESEAERADRKAKEKEEKEKDKDKGAKDEAGVKRKRDEAVSYPPPESSGTVNEKKKNHAEMTVIGIGTGTGTEEVIDLTILAIVTVIGIDGTINLEIEIEIGGTMIVDETIQETGTQTGIETDDPDRTIGTRDLTTAIVIVSGVDGLMIFLGSSFLLVLIQSVMGDLDLLIHPCRSLRWS
jgi:THO complex subunit 2